MKDTPDYRNHLLHPLLALTLQGSRFALVGLTATATHVAVMIALVELAWFQPMSANFFGFTVAVLISFAGHLYWTFGETRVLEKNGGVEVFTKFIVVALTSLALNSLAVFLVVDINGLHYFWAVATMITLVPLVVFLLSKFWVFS